MKKYLVSYEVVKVDVLGSTYKVKQEEVVKASCFKEARNVIRDRRGYKVCNFKVVILK